MRQPVITLLTDFGLHDTYVGAMKGAILNVNPEAVIVDLTHQVRPQAVEEGAFLLSTVIPVFPRGTIHVAVVDPGVGTERRALVIQTADATFVGPDNGLLSASLPDWARPAPASSGPTRIRLPAEVQAVQISNRRYFRPQVSATFHGRDIFAPVAAHLSLGVPLPEFGEPVDEILAFPAWRACLEEPGLMVGRVLYIDRFGNVITTVRETDLPGRQVWVQIASHHFAGLQRSYQDGPEFVVYIGSSGYLEIGRRNGNAAASLGIQPGERVMVRTAPAS